MSAGMAPLGRLGGRRRAADDSAGPQPVLIASRALHPGLVELGRGGGVLCLALLLLAPLASCQDDEECQPYQWNSGNMRVASAADPWPTQGTIQDVKPGEINCRFFNRTPAQVNYYTCTTLAQKYEISNEQLFFLNPGLKHDCINIQPNTDYCVTGFVEPVRANNGLCGPSNQNATCLGTDKPCCNSETWTCGDSEEDCAPGTCYEGQCDGDITYSTDGTCGVDHGNRMCVGKWGNCCSFGGRCGTGEDYCGLYSCQSGDCDIFALEKPPMSNVPPTEDGWCGGKSGLRCTYDWGPCCNVNNVCGDRPADCHVSRGCQSDFGVCASGTMPSGSGAPATKTSSSAMTTSQPTATKTTSAAVTTTTGTTAPAATWVPQGCYQDLAPDVVRPLPNRLINGSGLTIQTCQAACLAGGYSLAGVENSNQCFCGTDVIQEPSKNTPALESDCSRPCTGNTAQTCGAAARIFIYRYAVPKQQTWEPVGCFKDGAPITPRPLANRLINNSASLTIETCHAACRTGGYALAGLENGTQCFCGNDIQDPVNNVWVSSTECNKPCTGKNTQTCGAAGRIYISRYATPEKKVWRSIGCRKDLFPSAARPLDTLLLRSDTAMSIGACHILCQVSAYRYAGLGNGNQCWCGGEIRDAALNIPTDQGECRTACTGAKDQTCGSSGRIHIYEYVSA